MSGDETAIVVGAGHAASELATSLRNNGWQGRIVLIGEEPYLPYQRPPLSKAYLSGEVSLESLYLKPEATYDKARIECILGTRVESIDRPNKSISLSDGSNLRFEKLALTTGGRPRRLEVRGADSAERTSNFHYLRTIDDVNRIRLQMVQGMRITIVGGGYIGLEVAALATKRGLHVTLLEAQATLLARVAPPEISAFYELVHREANVDVRTGVCVEAFDVDDTAVAAVRCAGGERIPADLVVVGIGLVPNTELADICGLAVDNGILVDEFARTSDPDIVAAGDCTNHPNRIYGRRLRLESVPNALEQARTAAATLCGKTRPYNAVPWFWSDQYDLKLKIVGLSEGHDHRVMRGSFKERSFTVFYLKDGRLLAADTVNRPQDFMLAKRFIVECIPVDPSSLVDESIPLKSLLPPA